MIVLVLFLGGVSCFALSIIGSYLAHIYDEVKRRPPFVVESVINPPVPAPVRARTPNPREQSDA